jgi:transcriptional regulator with XRE-family HTH domain
MSIDFYRTSPPDPTAILKAIGETIKTRRKHRLLSEKRLAERCLLSRSTIQLIEKGHPGVSMGRYIEVMTELNMSWSLAKLATNSEDMQMLLRRNRIH